MRIRSRPSRASTSTASRACCAHGARSRAGISSTAPQPRYRGRERFTLAHEFGHYLLHRRPLTVDHYRDGELPDGFDFECLPLQANRWKDAEKEREEEADTFASYLLMPIDDYRNQVGGQEITRALLNHVTNRYGVSLLSVCGVGRTKLCCRSPGSRERRRPLSDIWRTKGFSILR